MKTHLVKTLSGLLSFDPDTEAWYKKIKLGGVVQGDFKTVRNPKFLRKWFALLNVGFDNWLPGEVNSKYGVPAKNFERFRADVIILCGFYDNVVRLDGSVRIEPKSVSFAKMTEESFEDLYSKTIDVMLKYVYDKEMTPEKLNKIVDQYLSFA
jgi:hypothetical protein